MTTFASGIPCAYGMTRPNDTLNRITAAQLPGPTLDFGFSDIYTEYRTGNVIGTLTNPPLIAFPPLGNLLYQIGNPPPEHAGSAHLATPAQKT